MERLTPLEKDYYLAEEWYSDENVDSDSSDDEVQKAMAKIAGIRRPRKQQQPTAEKKALNDFEADMETELDAAFSRHKLALFGPKQSWNTACSSTAKIEKDKANNEITNVDRKQQTKAEVDEAEVDPALGLQDKATDSDEEFLEEAGLKTAEDLFYDPAEDDDNQAWVDKHRSGIPDSKIDQKEDSTTSGKTQKSDAVLNCPACMAVLSMDCQRHEVYKTQYRAMFVDNCNVIAEESLFLPSGLTSASKKSKQKRKRQANNSESVLKPHDRLKTEETPQNCHQEDLFHPVQCSVCSTEVGVYDSDELYHFFNVLSSYA